MEGEAQEEEEAEDAQASRARPRRAVRNRSVAASAAPGGGGGGRLRAGGARPARGGKRGEASAAAASRAGAGAGAGAGTGAGAGASAPDDEDEYPLEPMLEPRPIDGLGWDLVRLRQLAESLEAPPRPGRAARSGPRAAAASRTIAQGALDHPLSEQPSTLEIWRHLTRSEPEEDWIRAGLAALALPGNGPLPTNVAHQLARCGKRLDGMIVTI